MHIFAYLHYSLSHYLKKKMGGEEEESISFKEHFQKQITQRPFAFFIPLRAVIVVLEKIFCMFL